MLTGTYTIVRKPKFLYFLPVMETWSFRNGVPGSGLTSQDVLLVGRDGRVWQTQLITLTSVSEPPVCQKNTPPNVHKKP